MKEAIVFVPAFDAKCQNHFLNNALAPGLLAQLEDIDIKLEPEDVNIPGQTGKRFTCKIDELEKTIDIYEVYWKDLVDRISSKDIKYKFVRGLYISFYWLTSGWQVMRISPPFFIQSSIILLLLIAWYYGVVILVLAALSQDTDLNSIFILKDFLGFAKNLATGQGWQVWLLISAFLTVLPVSINSVIDLINFFVCYTQNESVGGSLPLRALLRTRVKQSVDNVVKEGSYDRITILSHSFGSLIATDFLADYRTQHKQKIRFITWGSSLETASSTADWVKTEIKNCVENPCVESWRDFYSKQDWLCSKIPIPNSKESHKVTSTEISLKGSIFKQMSGNTHGAYFFDPKVLRHLVLG